MDSLKGGKIVLYEGYYFCMCPYCGIYITVHKNELNCKIFRCGTFKKNNNPIPPHASKVECDEYKSKGLIYGCGKPFIFKGDHVERCDYI